MIIREETPATGLRVSQMRLSAFRIINPTLRNNLRIAWNPFEIFFVASMGLGVLPKSPASTLRANGEAPYGSGSNAASCSGMFEPVLITFGHPVVYHRTGFQGRSIRGERGRDYIIRYGYTRQDAKTYWSRVTKTYYMGTRAIKWHS